MAGLVLPGDVVGSAERAQPGSGTFTRGSDIVASLAGRVTSVEAETPAHKAQSASSSSTATKKEAATAGALPVLSIETPSMRTTARVPVEGDVVMGRVGNVGDRQADVTVLTIGEGRGRALRSSHRGVIRREDVREVDVDRVVMLQSLRPGDVVRAKVLSLGDKRALFLSTAAADMGVVWARSRAGHVMVPASHDSMRCPVTGEDEPRKVARHGF